VLEHRLTRSSAASKVSFRDAENCFAIERALARADFAIDKGRPR